MASDYEARLNMLEAKVANLNLRDLPMSALMRKLEADWQPNAATLLEGGSIGIDALSAALTFGLVTLTWAGGTPRSGVLTVLHGLGHTPTIVVPYAKSNVGGVATRLPVPATYNYTTTTFDVEALTSDEGNPAAAATSTIGWLAL